MKSDDDLEYPEGARFGWEYIHLTEAELDEFCAAAFAGDIERADAIVSAAADRIFGEYLQ